MEHIRQIVISSTPLYPTILFNLRFNSTKCFPCLIFRKRENGVYYIAEGYNEKQMVADGFSNVTAGISAGRKMIRAMGDNFSEPVYGVKWVDAYAIYAACEKQDEKKLEGYNIVGTPGELIGKGGGLWSRHTPACIAEMVG